MNLPPQNMQKRLKKLHLAAQNMRKIQKINSHLTKTREIVKNATEKNAEKNLKK
jgi:hypothetical protein